MIYEPAEDSFLLAKHVKKLAYGKVLDVGTGSGIQATTALENKNVTAVTAVDKNPEAVKQCDKRIRCFQSDLFSKVKGKFDTIIFNPPYLPAEGKVKYPALEGGKKGYEILERFLDQVGDYLSTDGQILIVFSSLTNKKKVGEFIERNLFTSKQLDKEHIGFEDLFVYRITKTALRKKIDRKITNLRYLAKGKRGVVHTGMYKKTKVAVKSKRKGSKAIERIANEARMLEKVNTKGIGPKLLFADKDMVVYKFVEGKYMEDFLEEETDKEKIKRVLQNILDQCVVLDQMGIQKE